MGHGVKEDESPFDDDFGTGATSAPPVYSYIVQRAATFFQTVMNPSVANIVKNKHTQFVDCENYRNRCDTNNQDNSCGLPDLCN